ncbi:hypothetical protein [Prosthecobacter vanneervenii]|uniref:Uncharacterized protein n=1 Tax=Prosthecobacter vanneervenii TaxID=48466 RepID=A0A7W7Y9A0_9BACT|nr:hypothetical protein [Prosthecobacter vanneervenii]MBB5032008.1 hypothetical protein [Prosthecobacter vanneervenii]
MAFIIQAWREFWLSHRLRRAIEKQAARLFDITERKVVVEILACSTFPLLEQRRAESLRVKLAILILSQGKQERFQEMLALATRDWRDVLMAADMGWPNWQEILQRKGVW